MMTSRFFKLTMFLLAGAMMFSCSDEDDDNGPAVTNTLTYDGKEYQIKSGHIEDYGPYDPARSDGRGTETHYRNRFCFTDGDLKLVTNGGETYYIAENATYNVYVDLNYPSTGTFSDGEFDFIDQNAVSNDDIVNLNVYTGFVLWFDRNGNGEQDYEEEITELIGAGGEVTIEGSDKHYKVRFQIPLSDGKTATGSFETDFEFIKYRG
ncbi:hypothetical protein JMN32_05235 [Fulvivirga sp. 29W222]|uniref:Uncharacterized protein n=1 Tax=Fulvivirga marina TaxID=2494733 RepID=A0A937FWM0_9BACT|nr:hypothetical protein [Fulvivirga marina]MBL6445701.1 hypothetical protein [Fulvivirga marina]